MTTAANYDFILEQGATFQKELTLKDGNGDHMNLTGYTAKMQIRKTIDGDLIKEINESSGITITANQGKLLLSISATDTAKFNFRNAVYDLTITSSGGQVTRVIQGKITIDYAVTR
jgi:hypothetical protein